MKLDRIARLEKVVGLLTQAIDEQVRRVDTPGAPLIKEALAYLDPAYNPPGEEAPKPAAAAPAPRRKK